MRIPSILVKNFEQGKVRFPVPPFFINPIEMQEQLNLIVNWLRDIDGRNRCLDLSKLTELAID
jgi:hypothetical protein